MRNPIIERAMTQKGGEDLLSSGAAMTISGVVSKLMIMFMVLLSAFGVVFYQYGLGYMDKVNMLMNVGIWGGLGIAFVIIFTRAALPVLVPVYAFLEGLALGGFSAMLNAYYPGIVIQAVSITLFVLFALAMLYKSKVIVVTEKLKSIIAISTWAVFGFYMTAILLNFFHVPALKNILISSSPLGIGISLIVCVIAASNLLRDFEFIEKGVQNNLPRKYEWLGAFSLVVTLVWLYIEILDLLFKLNRNR